MVGLNSLSLFLAGTTHCVTEEYVSAVGELMNPQVKLGTYGYNPEQGRVSPWSCISACFESSVVLLDIFELLLKCVRVSVFSDFQQSNSLHLSF